MHDPLECGRVPSCSERGSADQCLGNTKSTIRCVVLPPCWRRSSRALGKIGGECIAVTVLFSRKKHLIYRMYARRRSIPSICGSLGNVSTARLGKLRYGCCSKRLSATQQTVELALIEPTRKTRQLMAKPRVRSGSLNTSVVVPCDDVLVPNILGTAIQTQPPNPNRLSAVQRRAGGSRA